MQADKVPSVEASCMGDKKIN